MLLFKVLFENNLPAILLALDRQALTDRAGIQLAAGRTLLNGIPSVLVRHCVPVLG